MKDETNKKQEENIKPNNLESNDELSKKTKSIEDKLNKFESEINRKSNFRKLNNNFSNKDLLPSSKKHPVIQSAKISDKNLIDLNNSNCFIDIKLNNQNQMYQNKIKNIDNKMNENNISFSENMKFPISTKNTNRNENIFNYSNFLDSNLKDMKERNSIQNSSKKELMDKDFLLKNSIYNPNIRKSNINQSLMESNRHLNKKITFTENSSSNNNNMDDLESKIKNTKEKLNKCLNKTMSCILDNRNFLTDISRSGKKFQRTRNFVGKNNKKVYY